VLWSLVTAPWSINPQLSVETAWERGKLVIISLVVVNALRTRRTVHLYLAFLIACFAVYPLRGALTNYAGGYTVFGRAIWNHIYANPNDLAAYTLLVVGCASALVAARRDSAAHRWLLGGVILACVLLLLLTQSRGAFLGAAVGFGLALVRWSFGGGKRFVIVAIAIVCVLALVPERAWDRFAAMRNLSSAETVALADPEGSAAQRLEIQKTALSILGDSPVAGTGLGTYKQANALYAPDLGYRDTHNTYLNIAAETGLFGLALWVAMLVLVVKRVLREPEFARDGPGRWLLRGLLAFLVAGVFGTYAAVSLPYLVLAVAWSWAGVSSSEVSAGSTVPSR
jgi:O-antigen ligase